MWQHTCEKASLLPPFLVRCSKDVGKTSMHLRCWGVCHFCCIPLWAGDFFCFRSSCPLGRLWGRCSNNSSLLGWSHIFPFFFFFLAGVSHTPLFIRGFSFDDNTIKLAELLTLCVAYFNMLLPPTLLGSSVV